MELRPRVCHEDVMRMSQIAEDGTIPLVTAMFGVHTKNGDFDERIGGLFW